MYEGKITTGGEHNAEKPIKIERDVRTSAYYIPDYSKPNEGRTRVSYQTPENLPKLDGNELDLTLSEALRVIEATVKFLNQTKNDGRQEQRTIKDKENQNRIDRLDECIGEDEDGNIMWIDYKLDEFLNDEMDKVPGGNRHGKVTLDGITPKYYPNPAKDYDTILSNKAIENQKIVDEIKKEYSGLKVATTELENSNCGDMSEYDLEEHRKIILHQKIRLNTLEMVWRMSGKDIKDL